MVTDKPGSYGVARRALMPETIHSKETLREQSGGTIPPADPGA
jgi:hypothetical protein